MLELKIFRAIANLIDRAEHVSIMLTGSVMFLMMSLTVYETLARYAFRAPVEWAIEVPGYTLTLCTAFALAFTQKVRGHIAVGFLEARLSTKSKGRLGTFLLPIYLGIILFITCGVFRLLQLSLSEWLFSNVMHVPLFIPNVIMFIGFILLDLQVIVDLAHAVSAVRKGTEFRMVKGE